MNTEQQDAFMTIEDKSRGLEETFLSIGSEMELTEDEYKYAKEVRLFDINY